MLYLPSAIPEDPGGRPVIVDFNNWRLRRIEEDGRLRTIAGNGQHADATLGAGPLETGFEQPADAVWDSEATLYVAGFHEGRVLRIPEGGVVGVAAGTGEPGHDGDGGPAVEAKLEGPRALALDEEAGVLYIADQLQHRVRRVAADGSIDTVVGDGDRDGPAEGPGTEVSLDSPEGLLWDLGSGLLLISDTGHNQVLAWQAATGEVTRFAGGGDCCGDPEGKLATEVFLDAPTGLARARGRAMPGVYIAERDAARVLRVEGSVHVVAGGGANGDERAMRWDPAELPLEGPAGIRFDEAGTLWIADQYGHRVFQLPPSACCDD
jgi:sugar lactone lactonase YvrE